MTFAHPFNDGGELDRGARRCMQVETIISEVPTRLARVGPVDKLLDLGFRHGRVLLSAAPYLAVALPDRILVKVGNDVADRFGLRCREKERSPRPLELGVAGQLAYAPWPAPPYPASLGAREALRFEVRPALSMGRAGLEPASDGL